jgi:murein DD-endopeptidase MepM/ murein hydrolase activator NlpD
MGYVARARGLGSTDIDVGAPEYGRPQPPIWPLKQGSHGGYLEVRRSPADGACGVGSYPCVHPGLDVAGAQGTPVRAPESGTVVNVADGTSSPFGGYGPWVVVIQGASGKFHLLGHLEPATASMAEVGQEVTAGDVVGTVSGANHTHWEVRSRAFPDFAGGESNATNNSDPVLWLRLARVGITGKVLLIGATAVLLALIIQRSRHG